MRLWILCTGRAKLDWPRRCDAAGFEAACTREANCGIETEPVRPIQAAGRPVYVAPGRAARETAELLVPGAALTEEPLLAAIPDRAFRESCRPLPLWLWRLMVWLQTLLGSSRQPKAARIRQAEALIGQLEARGEDCVLIASIPLVRVLMDRLRIRGCCLTRSGVLQLRPLERIRVSRREEHCGGCAHNCLLSNPGCGVGRDKAARKSA